jgi:large subunit ribosomal protein L13
MRFALDRTVTIPYKYTLGSRGNRYAPMVGFTFAKLKALELGHARTRLRIMTTYSAKPQDIDREWFVVDATDQILGRLATEVARRLRGKHKPIFTPHMDTGDFIVVINADKVKLTGRKWDQKTYYHHSGYPGGIKSVVAKRLIETKPEEMIKKAVWGMLPKNRLGRKLIKKLKVYAGPEHPHAAQQPQELTIKG